jgi:hypothetical protein
VVIPLILLKLAMRFGVPDRFRKLAAGAIGVVAILIVIGLGYCAFEYWFAKHDYAVINKYRDAANGEAATRAEVAGMAATADQMGRDANFQTAQEELKNEVVQKGTDAPAGPATAGVLARMRQQQAAGRR